MKSWWCDYSRLEKAMSDIIPNVVVSMPSQQFTLARKFQAASNGKIYIGKIDADPTIPSNQIQVYLENEDGSTIPVAQPLIINQAGFPVYNGQIAKYVTVEGHSMAVYDSYGTQQFYYPNVLKYDPDQFDVRIHEELKNGDGSLIGLSYNDSETSFDANSFAQLTVYADLFIEKHVRVIDGIHAACDYVKRKGGGYVHLSQKTYLLEDEIIPRDTVKIVGNLGGYWSGLSTLKWAGGDGTNKCVIRASSAPLGSLTTTALASTGVVDCHIDAEGCDVGFYSQYVTNGSDFSGLVVKNATKINIYILKSWFCDYKNISSIRSKGKGIVIAQPMFGEVGQMNVNACGFSSLKAHSNGVNTPNGSSSVENGTGIVLGMFMAANFIESIQAEGNKGLGLLSYSTYTNSIGSLYIESNAANLDDSIKNCGFMYESGGSFSALSISSLHLAINQYVINNVDLGLIIQSLGRNDNVASFKGTGRALITSSNLGNFSATDWSKIASDNIEIMSGKKVNFRYNSSFDAMSCLLSVKIGYPHIVIVPRDNYTYTNDLILRFLSHTSGANFGKEFVKDTPIIRRISPLTKGFQKLDLSSDVRATDTYFDVYVMYAKARMGGQAHPTLVI